MRSSPSALLCERQQLVQARRARAASAPPSPAPRRGRRRRSSRRWRRPRRRSPRCSRGRAAARPSTMPDADRRRPSRSAAAVSSVFFVERAVWKRPAQRHVAAGDRGAAGAAVGLRARRSRRRRVRSPSALKSTTPRSERPIRRWISTLRPSAACPSRRRAACGRPVEAGSIAYSAVSQPVAAAVPSSAARSPRPRRCR